VRLLVMASLDSGSEFLARDARVVCIAQSASLTDLSVRRHGSIATGERSVYIPPPQKKSGKVNFLWSNNDVRMVTELMPISCHNIRPSKFYRLPPHNKFLASSRFRIPGPFSNPGISGLESANPAIPRLIPGLGISKKTANLLAHKFLQAVFLSVK